MGVQRQSTTRWFLVVVITWATAAMATTADDRPVYRYTNDEGRTVLVDELASIPVKYRDQAAAQISKQLPDVVRYVTTSGRTAYTDDWARVPKSQRENATVVDLAAIPLNGELAQDLQVAINITYQKLIETDYCKDALTAAHLGWWTRLWDEYAHLLVLGAILVLLFALTPIMRRHVEVEVWAKVLKTAIPVLGFVALFSFSAVKTSKMQQALVEEAGPCEDDVQPGDARGKAQRIQALRPRLEKIYADHAAAIDGAMQEQ